MKLNSARDYFFQQIGLRLETEDIYIVSADLAGPPFDAIREKYPERFVQVGIAEQNMISVALGIATTGAKTIAYTANPFIALRAFDQIRNGAAMIHIPLTIVGVGTGFSISEYGTTHFCTEDVAIMRLCPGLKQVTVSDDTIAKLALQQFFDSNGLFYLRFDKMCGGTLFDDGPVFDLGFRKKTGSDSRVLLITEGYTSQVAKTIRWTEGYEPDWIDIFTLPFDEEQFLSEVEKAKKIVVCEEQQKSGGLGSALLELLNAHNMQKELVHLGIDYSGSFPEEYGSRDFWLNSYGINADAIQRAVYTGIPQ